MHESELTQTLVNSDLRDIVPPRPLRLLCGNHEMMLSPDDEEFLVGRDSDCSLVMETAYASRHHCTLAWQHDKFILKDHSTNGTWLQLGRAEPLRVHRETVPLTGAGAIKIGQAFDDKDTGLILFKF